MTRPRIQSIAAIRVDFAALAASATGAAFTTAEADGVAIECSLPAFVSWLSSQRP
jgi:hypothetical protein